MIKDKRSLETLIREAQAALILLGPDATVRDINGPALELLGGTREEYVGKDALSLVDPVDWFFVQRKVQSVEWSGIRKLLLTIRLRRKNRSSDWHMLTLETLPEELIDDCRLIRIQHVSLSTDDFLNGT